MKTLVLLNARMQAIFCGVAAWTAFTVPDQWKPAFVGGLVAYVVTVLQPE